MKRYMIVLCAALAALLAGCGFFPPVVGSGVSTTLTYNLADFSMLAASNACKVTIVPDTSYSVSVTCDDNVVSYLNVQKDGTDSMLLGLDQGHSYMMVTFVAEVHMPALDTLDLSGASEARVGSGFSSTSPLIIKESGASTVSLDNVTCGALNADISGASVLVVSGVAGSETVTASGASSANLLGCASGTAQVSLSGASEAKIDVGAGTVSVSASGASTLYLRGSPSLRVQDLSGASRVVTM